MNDKKIIIIGILLTIGLLFGGIFFLTKTTATPQITTYQNAKAYVAEATSFDWGNIPMYKGNAIKVFTIKNIGTDTLKIYNIKTSCHCTKAYATINEIDSPRFGMSDLSAWVGEVSAKKEVKLTVAFDPAYHGPQGTGPINRFVSVETNDKANAKLTFTLTGNVVK